MKKNEIKVKITKNDLKKCINALSRAKQEVKGITIYIDGKKKDLTELIEKKHPKTITITTDWMEDDEKIFSKLENLQKKIDKVCEKIKELKEQR